MSATKAHNLSKKDATFNSHGNSTDVQNTRRCSECRLEMLLIMCQWIRLYNMQFIKVPTFFRKHLFKDSKYLKISIHQSDKMLQAFDKAYTIQTKIRSKAYPGVVVTPSSVSCHACNHQYKVPDLIISSSVYLNAQRANWGLQIEERADKVQILIKKVLLILKN